MTASDENSLRASWRRWPANESEPDAGLLACRRLSRAVLLQALRDTLWGGNVVQWRHRGRLRGTHALDAQAFLCGTDEEARYWRDYWLAIGNLQLAAIRHACWQIGRPRQATRHNDPNKPRGPVRGTMTLRPPEETAVALPCAFIVRKDLSGALLRCVAMAMPESRYCPVHQPAPVPKRRLRARAERVEPES